MSWGTYAVAENEKSIGAAMIAGVIAVLLLAGGIALLRLGIRNKDRIIFDRHAGEVRFDKTKKKDSFSIPFGDIVKFKLQFEDRSLGSKEVNIVFRLVIIGIVLCFILFKTWNYFATILFGKCFLALSPSELDYEVFVFGLKSKAKSVKMPAADILSLAVKDPGRKGLEVQRRSGTPFSLSLQRFSEGELLRIKKRFLGDLGLGG